MELIKVGAECEVMAPKELRERMAGVANELNAIYRKRNSA